MQDAARVLDTKWRRKIWDHADETPGETQYRMSIARRYKYVRVGLGERILELLPDGSIGDGRANCEKRWTLRLLNGLPTIVILGNSHKNSEVGMMFLTLDEDGVWRGRWEFHERSPVELHPILDTRPPSYFIFRQGTWDRDIYDCVVRDNEYRLPASFAKTDIVIDIGAHIGSFSHACLLRGAGSVFAIEPHPDNFAILMTNLATKYPAQIRPVQAAIAKTIGAVKIGPFPGPNTGGTGIVPAGVVMDGAVDATAISFETCMAMAAAGKAVRLLKIDCEGAEWDIFASDRLDELLANVQEIAAELHTGPAWDEKVIPLETRLRELGYAVETKIHAADQGLGYLFAKRS
jgi:FkbM family methyltransferase